MQRRGIYLDVSTAGCGFTTTPRYFTSLGDGGHWQTTGATALYSPTPTGFRVYVRFSDDSPLTPAIANRLGWTLNWTVTTGRYDVVTKYYTFNGAQGAPRIAMRDENGLTYLHADQLGSTALTTNGGGSAVDDHGYYAYGKDRRGSELRTQQRFTGQPGDATGLVPG